MDYPIVKATTTDGYILNGLLKTNGQSKNIVIHIHGTAGNFYTNNFLKEEAIVVNKIGWSFLSTNNRGSGVYNIEVGTKYTGAAIEIFEECLHDIDAWIEYVLNYGYKNIILQGHSFGCNKIQHYILNGKFRSKIKAIILLGFNDAYGAQLEYLKKINKKNSDYLKEAQNLVNNNRPLQLLSDLYANCGELPQTAQSYLNFMNDGSVLSQILPLRNGNDLLNFRKIKIPILGVLGDRGEYTIIPPQDAMKLLENENRLAKCIQIKDCPHNYNGKEKELTAIIASFLQT